jgi:hypothetical protein
MMACCSRGECRMADGEFDYESEKARYKDDQPPEPSPALCLSVSDWLKRDMAPPDFLLGEWLSTTSRVMLVAPTGIGKTNFGIVIAFSIASGRGFLHWTVSRSGRVLFIDGEMSRRLLKMRLADAARRLGEIPEGLFILCRDDIEDMPPLNTAAGQGYIDRLIEQIGGVDLIVFDNVMSLLSGDMKDEESWQQTIPWVKALTKRSIGQLWIHHTGHNETHSYGTKTREWMLDTVVLLERLEQPGTDIAFTLTFTKSRERAPHNRADFDPATITLANDRWLSDAAPDKTTKAAKVRLPPAAQNALAALRKAIEASGEMPPASNHIPAGRMAVQESVFRRYSDEASISASDKPDSRLKAFKRAVEQLQAANAIGIWNKWVWLIK